MHLLWAGHEAVLLFFVLSGFVLGLSAFRRATPYPQFMLRRLARLYIPYVVVLLIAAALLTVAAGPGDGSLSEWFNGQWRHPVAPQEVPSLLFMLGGDAAVNVDGVTWSLVHEIRFSLAFPLLMIVVRRTSWRLCAIAAIWVYFGARLFVPPLPLSLDESLQYLPLFFVGVLLARHQASVSDFVSGSPATVKLGIICLAVLAYLCRWLWPVPSFMQDLMSGAGAVVLVVCVLEISVCARAASIPVAQWLGDISYSLYLIHCPILFTLVYLLRGWVPVYVPLALTPVVSLAIAHVLCRYVEQPAIAVSRLLGSRHAPNQPAGDRSPATFPTGLPVQT
jgi:peptidoglycan/LPS O-acetylase OafA/YrhL